VIPRAYLPVAGLLGLASGSVLHSTAAAIAGPFGLLFAGCTGWPEARCDGASPTPLRS
jgi:hypothetical protein